MSDKVLPIILVVEDDAMLIDLWRMQLAGVCVIQHAPNQGEAVRLWQSGQLIRLVVIGACTPGSMPNTQGLTAWFRGQSAEIPILSVSSVDDFAQINLEHGATTWVNKLGFAAKVKEMLSEIPVPLEVD